MAETITVARPYAEAIYSLASEQNRLKHWSQIFAWLTAIVSTAEVAAAVTHPYPSINVEALLLDMLGELADEDVKRFIAILLEEDRLLLLPEMAKQFEQLKTRAQGVLDATVETALPLTEQQLAQLTTTLSSKYHKVVRLTIHENPELLGGVRVLIGDDVIDASVRSKLHAMAASLKN